MSRLVLDYEGREYVGDVENGVLSLDTVIFYNTNGGRSFAPGGGPGRRSVSGLRPTGPAARKVAEHYGFKVPGQ